MNEKQPHRTRCNERCGAWEGQGNAETCGDDGADTFSAISLATGVASVSFRLFSSSKEAVSCRQIVLMPPAPAHMGGVHAGSDLGVVAIRRDMARIPGTHNVPRVLVLLCRAVAAGVV